MSFLDEPAWGERIEQLLADALPPPTDPPVLLHEAMRWAVEGGGKRIRPRLCLGAAAAAGGHVEDALMPACAIELLHSYTLVHDDLPAMDGDRERRGRPSVWAKFGEATAILAGDALQALAFATLARTPERRPGMCGRLLAALGSRAVGVVRGQAAELAATDRATDSDFIYTHKTADLFVAAVGMGAIAGGATDAQRARLEQFARELGVAFQHQDDLLDGDSPFGCAVAEQLVRTHTEAAVAALEGLPGDVTCLRDLAHRLMVRRW